MPERRRTKKRAVMTAVLLAAAVLGVLGFMSFRKSLAEKQRLQAISSVSSAQVTRRSLRTTIIGDGILSGGDAADLKVPKGILVNKVFVESGDMVAEGDLLATLDHNSIREKIAEVQGQIDSVDSSLMSIGEQEEEKIITSPVSGTVTDVFAAPGSSVAAVMENEGSLITLLSDSSLREFQVTGMTGDVLEIYVTKGSRVAQGDDLMKVRTVTDEPRRRQLLADREELSKSLKAYYALSKSDQITAGSDGVIKDVYLTENEVVKEISMTDTSSLAASLTGGNLDLSAYLSMMSAVYPENADGEHKAQRGSETDEFSLRIPSGEGTGDMDGNADMIEDEGFVLLSSDGETGGEAGFEEAFAGGEDAGFEAFEEGGEPVFTEEVSGEKDDGIWYGEGSDTPGSVSSREDSTYAEDIYEAISGTDDAVRDELRAKDGEGYGEEPGQPSYPEQENSPGAVYFDAEYGSTDYSPDSVDFGSGDNGGTGTGAASGSAAGSGTGLTLPDGMSLEDYIKAVVAAETASYAQQSENQDLMKQFADFMAGLPSGVSLSDVLRGVTLSNGMDVEGAVSSLSLPQNFTAQDFLNALVLPENASLRDSFYRLVNDLNSLGSALGSGGSLASVLSSLSSGLDMSSLIGASGLGSLLGAGVGLEALFGSGSDPGSAGLTSLLGSGLISSLLGGMSQVSSSAASFALVPAFSIGDAEKMHVTIAVNELDILTIAKGQEAEVTVEAIQGTTFPGKVTGIEMSGANNGGATRYNVTVELMRDSRMMENMTCTVSVLVSEAENVMSVPSSAVFTEQGKNYVYTSLADDGTLMGRTEVVTGIADETYVEIAEGLEEGRTVYYRSRTANIMDRMEEMENMYGQTQVQS